MSDAADTTDGGWERRYVAGDTPWDLGRAPPVLEALLADLPAKRLRVFVPGAGTGHDARAWARAGHDVTAVDIAPTAVALARALAEAEGLHLAVLRADLFDLPAAMAGAFDVVWEQTCFCALPPERRGDYARVVAEVLAPRGLLLALLWHHGRCGGPPYDVRREDAARAFTPFFDLEALVDVTGSIGPREGEFLGTWRKRGG